MRVPLSWLREHVALPPGESAQAVGEHLTRAGIKVEAVHGVGADLAGPLVVGRVLAVEELTGLRKPIRYTHVDVGEPAPRGIVCGATNFTVGDGVVVALPGAVLPGGVGISARRTYGRVSDGMICSARELGLGDDHAGILVLPSDSLAAAGPGADATALLGLSDEVLELEVTTDRGYCLSVRGVARETATAYGVAFQDPAAVEVPAPAGAGYPVRVDAPDGCDAFVALTIRGFDPGAPSPLGIQRRVLLAGMRPISLAVDVTNYVMLELGQPLHAYDETRLQGPIVVRRAEAGERIETLDGVKRDLTPEDLLITDDSGPIGIAGVMGGASTEISAGTTDIVVESAHFDPATVGRSARRHKLLSEASRRFERGVDPALQQAAARRAAELLVAHGGGRIEPGVTVVGDPARPSPVRLPADLPTRLVGRRYRPEEVTRALQSVGAELTPDGADLLVVPPTWRPDLTDPYALVEEVARLHDYETIPSVLPQAPAGRGLTTTQRVRRAVERAVAAAGYVETPCYPFVGPAEIDALGLLADDPRRAAVRLANPLSEEQPLLRTTLLPGLLAALRRNVARGFHDLALFESGLVFRPRADAGAAPRLPVDRRPSDAELAALDAALPEQPRHLAAVLAGARERPGWWGPGRPAGWADAVEVGREVGHAAGVPLTVDRAALAPWHPGRCAALRLDGRTVGHAGELHPRVVLALGLPQRCVALELDLDAVLAAAGGPVPAPAVSPFPVATVDVALAVAAEVPVAEVQAAIVAGAGPLLESARLFDVYTGEQVGPGHRSLAFALRLRAPDRTLTAEEVVAARDGAVAEAARRTGAVLRGG